MTLGPGRGSADWRLKTVGFGNKNFALTATNSHSVDAHTHMYTHTYPYTCVCTDKSASISIQQAAPALSHSLTFICFAQVFILIASVSQMKSFFNLFSRSSSAVGSAASSAVGSRQHKPLMLNHLPLCVRLRLRFWAQAAATLNILYAYKLLHTLTHFHTHTHTDTQTDRHSN